MEDPGPLGSGAGVPVGGRSVRESRCGEGEGGAAQRDGGAVRRQEGDFGGGPRSPGVDGELVGGAAGPLLPGSAFPEADCRRRPPGDLGGGAQRLPGGRGAAVLEPPDREHSRQDPQEEPGACEDAAAADPVRGDGGGRGQGEGEVPVLVPSEGVRGSGRADRGGGGSEGPLLPVPAGSLAASADRESGGVAVFGTAVAAGFREAVQEGQQRDGAHLEDAPGGRVPLPGLESSGADEGRVERRALQGRSEVQQRRRRSRRLNPFYTLIDGTSFSMLARANEAISACAEMN